MVADLKALVEQTVDATIRSFNPDDLQSYDHWDAELRRLEDLLVEATFLPEQQIFLALVRAQRIGMAYDLGKVDLVLEQSTQFVRSFPASFPSFFLVATLRARALHITGAHEEELEEILRLVMKPEIHGSEFIFLLENLAKRHPGSLPSDELLAAKMREAISALREQGYDILSPGDVFESQLEQTALRVASEIRQENQAKAEDLLTGGNN